MQSFLKGGVAAIASGMFCFMFAIWVLTDLGLRRHGNYEYYGGYWWVYCGAGLIGLFMPSFLAWVLRKLTQSKS